MFKNNNGIYENWKETTVGGDLERTYDTDVVSPELKCEA